MAKPAGFPSVIKTILLAGLTVAVLDGLEVVIFYWFYRGTAPSRIFQGIAAGLLGRPDALGGGMRTAWIGAACHLTVATSAATVYILASRVVKGLTRQTVLCGFAYGIGVWLFMNKVTLPLVGLGGGPLFVWPGSANGIAAHLFCVGLPIAIWARRLELSVVR